MKKKAVLLAVGHDYPRDSEWALLTSPPLSVLALGSYLEEHDLPVEVIDVQMDFGFGLTRNAERIIAKRVARYLHNQAGTIAWIGISQVSNSGSGIILAEEIHTALPETPLILGGYFPSSNHRSLLENCPFITAIVRGDGEAAALQISQRLEQGLSFLNEETPNLAWLDEGNIRSNPVQVISLDNLPIFNFRLLRNKSDYQVINMMTARGCPFRCNYCLESTMRPYSTYPSEWVNRQLAHIEAELPNRCIVIADPIFGIGQARTLELCQVMGAYPFTYCVESRVDALSSELVAPMRRAGVKVIYWGVESASIATLQRMNKVQSSTKGQAYLENALEVLKACFENDVTPTIGLMIGFPGDSEADLRASLEFTKQVSDLHSQIAAEADEQTGFIPNVWLTQIYDGSPLAKRLSQDFPEIALRSEPYAGESTVVSPSSEVDLDMILHYQMEIERYGVYTAKALERMDNYVGFSIQSFLETNPELMDNQDVIMFRRDLQRPPV